MDRARDELLPGARLAREEHGRGRRRHLVDQGEHGANDGRVPDDGVARRLVALQRTAALLLLCERLQDHEPELVLVERLREVVLRAPFQRLDGAVDRAVRREHDHGETRVTLFDPAKELESIHPRHPKIRDDEVGALFLQDLDRFHARRGRRDVVAVASEVGAEHLADARFVIHDQDVLTHREETALAGKATTSPLAY